MSNLKNKKTFSYKQSGVDINSANTFIKKIKPLVKNTKRIGADVNLGGFGALFDIKSINMKDPMLVSSTDGVGTKLKIAFATNTHNTIGIDLVAMCVNDLIVQGAQPLFFLDYFATNKLNISVATEILSGIVKGCIQSGASLIGGETAEMPGIYNKEEYDIAGFCVGAVERNKILPTKNIIDGDIILGLKSNGIHSNGFALINNIIKESDQKINSISSFDKNKTLGEALLTPTRIYVKSCLNAINETNSIKALAHITGGGITENLKRILNNNISAEINLNTFNVPKIFSWIAKLGNIKLIEMLKTFNCGIGMILIVKYEQLDNIIKILNNNGETTYIIGKIINQIGGKIIYKGSFSI